MKKSELLQKIDQGFLDRLYGFCYGRTRDSYEAQELCSDILLALVKGAGTTGEITDMNAYIWRICKNVYADFSRKRAEGRQRMYTGDPDELFALYAQKVDTEDDADQLNRIYRGIGLLSKAYRDVMIAFYLDGLSTKQISGKFGISETTVRQRLFAARKNVQNEVLNVENAKPVSMEFLEFSLWGSGNPAWSDPRKVCTRQLSKHVVWLCRKKPQTARSVSDALHIPMTYAEEELKILTEGENGKYGMLREEKGGKYTINFVLLDKTQISKLWDLVLSYRERVVDAIVAYIEDYKADLLAIPFINKRVDLNLVLWQRVVGMANRLGLMTNRILKQEFFADVPQAEQPFLIGGYQNVNGTDPGVCQNGIEGRNICGYSYVYMNNMDCAWVKRHFSCGHNLGRGIAEQLAIRAIYGIAITDLTEREREDAAKAIEEGYLYREEDKLYTKILCIRRADGQLLYDIVEPLGQALEKDAKEVARQLAGFIRENIPDHLLGQWSKVCDIAHAPMQNVVIDALIKRDYLIPPSNGIGAEGCLLMVDN